MTSIPHSHADRMTSCLTPHTARRIDLRPGDPEHWRCTWLPHRALDRNQAITAMTIAELAAAPGTGHPGLLAALAAELGLTGPDALAAALRPPHVLSTSCWCQPRTAFDGHRNDGEVDVDFEAMAGDPIDPAGYPLEVSR